MTKLNDIKAAATQAWTRTRESLTGALGVVLGGLFAFGMLTIGLTLGLIALGFSMLLLLIALPLGGLNALREKFIQAA